MVRVFLAAIAVLALAACTNPGSVPAGAPSAPGSAMPTSGAVPSEPEDEPTTSDPAPPSPGSQNTAMVRVTTDGPASVTFTENGSETRENITGPWQRRVELTKSPTELAVVVEADSAGGTVGCEIKADGVDISNMSSGGSVTATCTTTIP